jgi:uncharacterized protein (DUF433 family)
MTAPSTHYQYLERDRFSSYRQLSIKGRRIRAYTLYCAYMNEEEPRMPEQIAADYGVPLEAVHEAIAYCRSNPRELAMDFLWQDMLMEATGMNDPNYKGQPKQLTPQERAELERAFALRAERELGNLPSMEPVYPMYGHLAANPESAYKQLFIKGTRIRAEVIYNLYAGREPRTPEEIAAAYGLPLEAVREAIAYCESDPPEIAEDHAGEERVMEATGMNDPDYKYGGKYRLLSPQDRARLGI